MRVDKKQMAKNDKYASRPAIFDVFSNDTGRASPIDQRHIFDYIHQLSAEMRLMALRSGNDFLAYLLAIAAEEARRARDAAQPERNYSA
jgi:hypothetical protein